VRENQTQCAAGNSQQNGFRQHLLQQATRGWRPAPRESHSPCVATASWQAQGWQRWRRRSADKRHCSQQDQQCRANVADQIVAQRNRRRAPTLVVFGILLRQPFGDGVELGFRLLSVTPGFSLAITP
jgi:hypothetical protein